MSGEEEEEDEGGGEKGEDRGLRLQTEAAANMAVKAALRSPACPEAFSLFWARGSVTGGWDMEGVVL